MMMSRSITGLLTLCLALSLLSGCISPKAAFYTLDPLVSSGTSAPAPPLDPVEIGPLALPDLYDRPQFVARVDANRVEILEMQRWAAPLKSEIPRIIAENLSVLLKPAQVWAYPRTAGLEAGYRVQIDIQRFEMTAGQGATLDALWSVRRTAGGKPQSGRTQVREPAGSSGYDALVAAQSRALAVLSRDLAQALRTLSSGPP